MQCLIRDCSACFEGDFWTLCRHVREVHENDYQVESIYKCPLCDFHGLFTPELLLKHYGLHFRWREEDAREISERLVKDQISEERLKSLEAQEEMQFPNEEDLPEWLVNDDEEIGEANISFTRKAW